MEDEEEEELDEEECPCGYVCLDCLGMTLNQFM
jgi:hypothetical protein